MGHKLLARLRGLLRRGAVMVVLALYTPAAALSRLSGIWYLRTGLNHRIGHLISEPLYCELLARSGDLQSRRFVMLVPHGTEANAAVLECLPSRFLVIQRHVLCAVLAPLQRHPWCNIEMLEVVRTAHSSATIFKHLDGSLGARPFLKIPDRSDSEVADLLASLGIGPGQWFVCLHSRESGYSPADEHVHSFRNSTVAHTTPAAQMIAAQGGVVVRMGDPTMSPTHHSEAVRDYARSEVKSPRNDLILASHCSLFLGNTSGAFMMAAAQGRPILGINMAPMGASRVWGPRDMGVPKLYIDRGTRKPLSFRDVFDSGLADIRYADELEAQGVELAENSPEEITAALAEFMTWMNQGYPPELTQLQVEFDALFRPGNYTYFSRSRISATFLERHRELFD